jgi:hypothetical protein
MKKLKHSKYKNAGILFELLVRQVTADILNGKDDSKANNMLRKYFSENTELGRENALYRVILEEKTKDQVSADRLLDTVLRTRKKLNERSLNLQKYELIKEIKQHYPLDDFLKGSISNYKLLASIYKVFEDTVNEVQSDPREMFKARSCIVESIVASKTPTRVISEEEKKDLVKVYQQQNEDVRLLAYKLLVDSFNEKYKGLDEKQKILIREYINNISNTNSLRQYINAEVPEVRKQISELKSVVNNEVVKIKIDETLNQLDKIIKGTLVKENQIMALMLSYELIKELKNIK